MTRPAHIRFYVDADILGLAKVLVILRSDVTFPGDPGGVVHKRERPPCPIGAPSTDDVDWIPAVAALGWLIITRDANIHELPAELAAVRDSTARMVNLVAVDAMNTWGQLRTDFATGTPSSARPMRRGRSSTRRPEPPSDAST